MTAPSLLDELEGVVRLMDAASFVDLDWDWRRDDDDTPGSIFTHSFGGMHQAVAMCPRYGKDNFASDANYIIAMHNFIRAHHAELADMANELRVARESFKRCDEICKCTAEGWRTAEEDMAKRLEAAERDSKRLDFMEREHCTVRAEATCDGDVFYEVVDYYMAEPQERVIGSGTTPRDALDAAIDATQEGEE